MAPVAMRLVCEAMKIEPGSVESLLKSLQLDPAFPPNFDKQFARTSKMELKNENLGSQTLERCWSLELFEMMGRETVIKVCHGMEPPTYSAHCRWHNPNIVCRAVKLPPRQSPDETPACIFEYYVQEQDTES